MNERNCRTSRVNNTIPRMAWAQKYEHGGGSLLLVLELVGTEDLEGASSFLAEKTLLVAPEQLEDVGRRARRRS